MSDISTILSPIKHEIDQVDAMISDRLRSNLAVINDLNRYIAGEGKRLRSALALLSSLACSYRGDKHIKLGVAVELIHTATLLHDDVIDHASKRRGKSAAPKVWGNHVSVLTGDFLYSRAFQILCEIGNYELVEMMSNTTNTIAEGEVQQMINIGREGLDETECLQVAERKTAKLFEAVCWGGAALAGSNSETKRSLSSFGINLGLAFQLRDDLLDYTGVTGKSQGKDLKEGKLTLPLIHAMQHASAQDVQTLKHALYSDRVSEVVNICNDTGSFDYVHQKLRTYTETAARSLQDLTPSPYKDSLKALLQFLVDRSY